MTWAEHDGHRLHRRCRGRERPRGEPVPGPAGARARSRCSGATPVVGAPRAAGRAPRSAAVRSGTPDRPQRGPLVAIRRSQRRSARPGAVPSDGPTRVAAVPDATVTAPPPGRRPRLLLLDGHSLAYRAFFALPVENFSTTTGQPTNAVYGFTSMLINVLRDEQPTHVAVAFDVSRQTFRTEEYAEYKANRSKTPDEFKGQVPLIKRGARRAPDPDVREGGLEADDVIATLATQARADGIEVLICTGDRDTLPAGRPTHTTVLYPMRGVSRAGADDAGGGRGEVRRPAGAATPTSPPSSARPATTCRASPASGRRPRQVDQPVRRPRRHRRACRRDHAARRARRCASTSTA